MKRYTAWTPPKSDYKPKPFGPSECDPRGAMTLQQQIERMEAAGIMNQLNLMQMYPNNGEEPDFEPIDMYSDAFEIVLAQKYVLNLGMEAATAAIKAKKDADDIRAKEAQRPDPIVDNPAPEPA